MGNSSHQDAICLQLQKDFFKVIFNLLHCWVKKGPQHWTANSLCPSGSWEAAAIPSSKDCVGACCPDGAGTRLSSLQSFHARSRQSWAEQRLSLIRLKSSCSGSRWKEGRFEFYMELRMFFSCTDWRTPGPALLMAPWVGAHPIGTWAVSQNDVNDLLMNIYWQQ